MNGENPEAPPHDTFHARLVEVLSDRYDLGAEIGRGGMGIVYRALDRRLQRTVALKLLPPELAFRADIKSRFLREAVSAAQLSHPNIVPIYSVDEQDGLVFFAMGFVDGENLGTILARERTLQHARVRVILREVAEALAYAHESGVIHRDIKSDNIIIDRASGRAMVTDFGIARALSDVGDTKLTATGVAIGTPAYMSPEQCVGDGVDGRSDLYSLGVLGYQMLCGRTPFEASNTPAMLIKQFSEMPEDLRRKRPDTPSDLANIIMRLLEKKPQDRFENGRVLVAALDGEIAVAGAARRAEGAAKPEKATAPVNVPDQRVGRIRRKVKFRDKTLAAQLKHVRWEASRTLGMSIFFLMINIITTDNDFFPWFLFPTLGMSLGVWGKLSVLMAEGLRLRDIFGPNARQIMIRDEVRQSAEEIGTAPERVPQLAPPVVDSAERHVSREVLQSVYGPEVRQAIADHEGIRMQVARLSVADRRMIPDVLPTAKALFDRVALLALSLVNMDRDVDPDAIRLLDERIAAAERDQGLMSAAAAERKLSLLRKQRSSLEGLVNSRSEMHSQFESATLILRNLALDVLKLRSAGIQSVLSDVNGATQEARALVKEIGHVLGAAEELRAMESKSRRE